MKVPKNVQDGQTFRIRGAAVNNTNYDAGDLFVTVRLSLPNNYETNGFLLLYTAYVDVLKSLKPGYKIKISASESIDGKELEFEVDNSNGGELRQNIIIPQRGVYINQTPFAGSPLVRSSLQIKLKYVYNKD